MIDFKSINWEEIQQCYDNGSTWREIKIKFNIHTAILTRARKEGLLSCRNKSEANKMSNKIGHLHTEDTKNKQSVLQRNYLTNNPDKHPWRKHSKYVSVPCEHFKSILRNRGIKFEEEFQPGQGKNYSIDITIGNVGIEINGNQHYQKDGSLKPYYKERQDFLESIGWTIINVPYKKVYDKTFVDNLVSKVVPKVGVEPTSLSAVDFESTVSAIPPLGRI